MARILSDLVLIAKKLKGDQWQLVEPLYYNVGDRSSDEVLIVPKGFITDGASTPFGIRNLFPKDGTYTPAAAIHDYLYQKKIYSRKKSDQIFLEAMKVLGVPWWKRKLMYRALRLFGWYSWNHPRNEPAR